MGGVVDPSIYPENFRKYPKFASASCAPGRLSIGCPVSASAARSMQRLRYPRCDKKRGEINIICATKEDGKDKMETKQSKIGGSQNVFTQRKRGITVPCPSGPRGSPPRLSSAASLPCPPNTRRSGSHPSPFPPLSPCRLLLHPFLTKCCV